MSDVFAPLSMIRGPTLKNRFLLAPLTNTQSHDDGTLSDDEFHWLTLRARGGFGATMTCAAHVQAQGRGFPGQLGVFDDRQLDGLSRLAAEIRRHDSAALVQLHHAGCRSPAKLVGTTPVAPSAHAETGARALSADEVKRLRDDFVAAAVRSERAGFDGVELHGAHGYVLCAFLSVEENRREDAYGGSPEHRARLLNEILEGIRAECRADFCVGVRLSPERFGLDTGEMIALAGALMAGGRIDYLDLSLWDVFKAPVDPAYADRTLVDLFAPLPRHGVRVGAAGRINSAADVRRCMEAGLDWVMLGRTAILHHDFPQRMAADPDFEPIPFPVSEAHLRGEGVSPTFVDYLRTGLRFPIADEAAHA